LGRIAIWTLVALAMSDWGRAGAAPPSIETFAARSRIEGVAVSPDGRYLSLIQTQHGTAAVVVIERKDGTAGSRKVVLGEPENFRIAWCRWATDNHSRQPIRHWVTDQHGQVRRDSPRLHAADFRVPVLLLHGDSDAQVPFEQSVAMDSSLTHADKPHRFIAVHGAATPDPVP
jgi:fermentation-respiration switch protein FrsA (DUF1100 family)